jgi:two-component sensor histidine kinase/CheY-like chemotaxis protein
MNILIVDDHEGNRYLLASLLKGNGHTVGEAPDGKKALEMLEGTAYDLVISDILMPVMDGYRLCREVRSRDRLRDLPFVFLTATYVEEKDELFALKLGADRFYRKPFEPRTFVQEIMILMEEIKNGKKRRPGPAADEKEILTLYNERLIHKLEAKMTALENEIAERMLAEEKMQAALKEKEVLLREVHHRVKNNMQIISSLINLSARNLRDPETLDVLRQIRLRIRSMSMIHEKLMKSGDLVHVDFADFLDDMSIHYFQFYKADPERIGLKLEVEPVIVPIGIAVPCGLIAGELVSNALKHAFPSDRRGEVVVGLKVLPSNEVLLRVRDNGVGIPADVDIRKTETIGMTILNALVDQINGRLELDRENGSDFRVIFGLPAS